MLTWTSYRERSDTIDRAMAELKRLTPDREFAGGFNVHIGHGHVMAYEGRAGNPTRFYTQAELLAQIEEAQPFCDEVRLQICRAMLPGWREQSSNFLPPDVPSYNYLRLDEFVAAFSRLDGSDRLTLITACERALARYEARRAAELCSTGNTIEQANATLRRLTPDWQYEDRRRYGAILRAPTMGEPGDSPGCSSEAGQGVPRTEEQMLARIEVVQPLDDTVKVAICRAMLKVWREDRRHADLVYFYPLDWQTAWDGSPLYNDSYVATHPDNDGSSRLSLITACELALMRYAERQRRLRGDDCQTEPPPNSQGHDVGKQAGTESEPPTRETSAQSVGERGSDEQKVIRDAPRDESGRTTPPSARPAPVDSCRECNARCSTVSQGLCAYCLLRVGEIGFSPADERIQQKRVARGEALSTLDRRIAAAQPESGEAWESPCDEDVKWKP